MGHLRNSHFAPIDIPIMTAVSSFVVQGYFCYRIWMLNKKMLWFCCIIFVVCIPDHSRVLVVSDVFHHECSAQLLKQLGHYGRQPQSVPYIFFTEIVISYTAFSHSAVAGSNFPRQLYSYVNPFRLSCHVSHTRLCQLWSIPSALADILIAVAMTVLVWVLRDHLVRSFQTLTEILFYSKKEPVASSPTSY